MNKSQARKESILTIASKSNLAKKLEPALAADPGIKKALGSVTVAEILAFKPDVKPKARAVTTHEKTGTGLPAKRGRPVGSGKAPPMSEAQVLVAVTTVSKTTTPTIDIETGIKTRWIRATEIAGHLGVTTAAVRKGLGALVKAGKLQVMGKAAGTRYALAG
jgi:hypothetical protein